MATKELTVKVKLNTSEAERKIKAFKQKIESTNKAVNQAAGNATRISKQLSSVNNNAQKVANSSRKIAQNTNNAANASNRLNDSFKKNVSTVDRLVRNIRRAYVLIQGLKAIGLALDVSDQVTSAQNRLNNLNGYDKAATEQDMRKMFNSAMKTRTGYSDMISNVSKSMTLAGGAFGGNIDNAIRFQEIMAEAYTVGGASAAEQAQSMYQMIQALGSGVLQGDELKSVREGAPLAYQAIEKFAQGVYNSTESLKEMASQGKITSDIVVAAIMQAGTEMDDAFSKSAMTYAQALQLIKNSALESFRPMLQEFNDFLNSDMGQAMLAGIMNGIRLIAIGLTTLLRLFGAIGNFLYQHKILALALVTVMGLLFGSSIIAAMSAFIQGLRSWFLLSTLQLRINGYLFGSTIAGFIAAHAAVLAFIAVILLVIWVFSTMVDSFQDACGKMAGAAFVTGAAIGNAFKAVANGIHFAFNWAFEHVASAFGKLVNFLLTGLKLVGKGMDLVAGTNIVSQVQSWQDAALKWGSNKVSANTPFQYTNLGDAFNKGYGYGTAGAEWLKSKTTGSIKDKLSNVLGYDGLDLSNIMNPESVTGNNALEDIADKTGKIADNSDKVANSMATSEEYLKLLRQIAEESWKERATSVNINVAMNNNNTIKSSGDLDGLVTQLTKKLEEELNATASGVYA